MAPHFLKWPGMSPRLFPFKVDAQSSDKPMKTTHHGPQDYQSLLMHRKAVSMVRADPALIEKALGILSRWDGVVDSNSKPLRDEWVRILKTQNWSLALEESDRGNQLRQASPMAILLPQKVRLQIIQDVKCKIETSLNSSSAACEQSHPGD